MAKIETCMLRFIHDEQPKFGVATSQVRLELDTYWRDKFQPTHNPIIKRVLFFFFLNGLNGSGIFNLNLITCIKPIGQRLKEKGQEHHKGNKIGQIGLGHSCQFQFGSAISTEQFRISVPFRTILAFLFILAKDFIIFPQKKGTRVFLWLL